MICSHAWRGNGKCPFCYPDINPLIQEERCALHEENILLRKKLADIENRYWHLITDLGISSPSMTKSEGKRRNTISHL